MGAQVGSHRLLPPSLCSDASVQCLHPLDHCKAIKHADSSWPETVFPMASCKAFVILYQQVEHRDPETRQQNGSLWVVKLDVFVFSVLLTDIFLVKSKWGGQLRGGIRYVVLFLNKSKQLQLNVTLILAGLTYRTLAIWENDIHLLLSVKD